MTNLQVNELVRQAALSWLRTQGRGGRVKLAELAGEAPSSITQFLTGKRQWKVERLCQLATVIGKELSIELK